MLGLEVLTASDLTAAGFVVTGVEPGGDGDGYGVLFRAGRDGAEWKVGIGAEEDADASSMDRYFQDIVDALLEPAGQVAGDPAPERLHDLGDDAIHAAGWLYVKRRARVFWVFATGGDPAVAATLTRQLARRG